MARTIMVSDDVYEALKREKRPGESFSEVIRRLLDKNKPRISDLAGRRTITKEEWLEVERAFRAQRELSDRRRNLLLQVED
ncbi:MAG TPA: antitoxin [Candidatus Korarchaeota archaeon]|nr:antitoxin [Candidatus Korarchaeota archaeon]